LPLATLRKKFPTLFVIPSEARNLSYFSRAQTAERFLASLGMTKYKAYSATLYASAEALFVNRLRKSGDALRASSQSKNASGVSSQTLNHIVISSFSARFSGSTL